MEILINIEFKIFAFFTDGVKEGGIFALNIYLQKVDEIEFLKPKFILYSFVLAQIEKASF